MAAAEETTPGAAPSVPVVLFAHSRPEHLRQVLASLRENQVPRIIAYADGARDQAEEERVAAVRRMLRAVDWAELTLVERGHNLGLGRNVRAGVGEVAEQHPAFIVWEDDLIAIPGTYTWLCAALQQHEANPQIMSVSAWTHPRITPADVYGAPYLDARAECWVWGAWARSWRGMESGNAREKQARAAGRGVAPDAYGSDLPIMARDEERRNLWAVRWLYHHLEHGGLCLRPPRSLVEHIGFDAAATNAAAALRWRNPPLLPLPPHSVVPSSLEEHPACRGLWVAATRAENPLVPRLKRALRKLLPNRVVTAYQQRFLRVRWEGDFATWADARNAGTGYDRPEILHQIEQSTQRVVTGHAGFERDGVAFPHAPEPWSALPLLREAAAASGGRLHVLDFGGSLGSTYHPHREVLSALGDLRWSIIEQPDFVAAGKRAFETEVLRFHETIPDAVTAVGRPPEVVLLGSSLSYVPDPLQVLKELVTLRPRLLLVERTLFSTTGQPRLTLQRVPPSIYRASYPCWFLEAEQLMLLLTPEYQLTHDLEEPAPAPAGAQFRSLYWRRKNHP
jgi:putative methyltransferase (TIGR04325 family)